MSRDRRRPVALALMDTQIKSNAEQILVIDDDVELCKLVTRYLTREGFQIEAVHGGASGAERALSGNYALVVLDVMMPGINGFEVLRRIRVESRLPVLMLTAKGDALDRVLGLEMGADDYLPKPFNPQELAARIRAILRRARPVEQGGHAPSPPVVVGDVEMNPGSRVVRRGGETISLRPSSLTCSKCCCTPPVKLWAARS